MTRKALLQRGVYWYVMPTYRMAKDSIWRDPNMLFTVIPQAIIDRKNESDMVIWLKNGSIIQLKGADNPESLRGAGPLGIILDEFDDMKVDVWPILEPIVRANNGWVWFIGTPKGKLKLFEHYQRGLQGNPEWKSWLLKASKSGIFSPDQLANARLTSSQALFNQEYECEFLEGEGSVFRNVREIMTEIEKEPVSGHLYVMGVDLAKVQDYTVLAVYDRYTNKQVYQKRIRQLEWPTQKEHIKAVCKKYNNALLYLDATGLGDPIYDDLVRDGIPVEPVKLTSESKKDLVDRLSIYIEQKHIRMLKLDESAFEFDNFSYEIGPTGRIRYAAREGFHDDIVIAHALAVWSLQPSPILVEKQDLTIIQRDIQNALENYGKHTDADYAEYEYEDL